MAAQRGSFVQMEDTMRIHSSTDQNLARQARAVVGSLVAGALFVASVLTARYDATAPSEQAKPSVETPASAEVHSAPTDPALSRLDAVVHHG